MSSTTVTYPGEADFYEDPICVLTPVGAALIGLPEGQSITYSGSRGKTERDNCHEGSAPARGCSSNSPIAEVSPANGWAAGSGRGVRR